MFKKGKFQIAVIYPKVALIRPDDGVKGFMVALHGKHRPDFEFIDLQFANDKYSTLFKFSFLEFGVYLEYVKGEE